MKFLKKKRNGFALIELLLIIAIISVLAVMIFVAINPAQRFKDARDKQRLQDVDAILTAIHSSIVDSNGVLPTGLTNGMTEVQFGTSATGCTVTTGGCLVTTTACLDLTTSLSKYLKSIPQDPNGGTAAKTNYSVAVDTSGVVMVNACGTEGPINISTSR